MGDTAVLVSFSHHCDQIPDINNLKEEMFILVMVSKGLRALCRMLQIQRLHIG
jgi:hypothetical protein